MIFWDSNRYPRQYIVLSEILFTSATLKSSISKVIFMAVYRDSVSLSRESLLPTSPDENETTGRCCTGFWIDRLQKGLRDWGFAACELAKRNARNGIFSVKMGMALILVSLLIFMDHSDYKDISTHSVWAILTVVVVFEFTIGATLRKGFNRGLGTLSAGALALAVAALASDSGWTLEPVVIIISVFTTGSLATFAKLYPELKSYEYCFTVFILTFCYILDSGSKTRDFSHVAVTRFLLIAMGAAVSLAVNACIYPIWAGEDLHKLIVKNFTNVADSIEGCVNEYLSRREFKRISSAMLTCQAADDPIYSGYRSVLVSAKTEETLEGFARWEPPHGRYRMMKYPWQEFVRVGGALRHCASVSLALHGCTLSEIQPSFKLREEFSNELRRVSSEAAKVLREVGHNMENMSKLKRGDILDKVKEAAMDLQKKINSHSHLLVNSQGWVISPDNRKQAEAEAYNNMEASPRGRSYSESKPPIYPRSDGGNVSPSVSKEIVGCNEPKSKLGKQRSWASKYRHDQFLSFQTPTPKGESESSTARLSLATFASLLIEFVARLDNVVNSFQLLSVRAKFREPIDTSCPTRAKELPLPMPMPV